MKHSTYIATITIGSVFFISLSLDTFALNNGENYMDNNVNSFINGGLNSTNSISESNNNDESNNENIANIDNFSVTTYEIKKGNLSIGNVDNVYIDGNLYIYGNLDISNVDSFKVSGKLKITGNLIVGNGDLENSGRIYIGGKRKFSNGSIK